MCKSRAALDQLSCIVEVSPQRTTVCSPHRNGLLIFNFLSVVNKESTWDLTMHVWRVLVGSSIRFTKLLLIRGILIPFVRNS